MPKRPVVTYLDVDGVQARVHGDKPLTPEGEEAMKELMKAAAKYARKPKNQHSAQGEK